MVRGSGITPTDPYLERCWLPMVGPSTVALVRHVADLTAESGEARLPLNDLSRPLGLGAADVPSRNNKLVRTLPAPSSSAWPSPAWACPANR